MVLRRCKSEGEDGLGFEESLAAKDVLVLLLAEVSALDEELLNFSVLLSPRRSLCWSSLCWTSIS